MIAKAIFTISCIILTIKIDKNQSCITGLFPQNEEKAVAILDGSFGGAVIQGRVSFNQATILSDLKISLTVSGLPANSSHGFHIHEWGINSTSNNVTIRCGTIGSHYNPQNQTHGGLNSNKRHLGDLGNVEADENGKVSLNFTVKTQQNIALYGQYSIIGRSVALHQNKDDLGMGNNSASLITGNSGSRIACGVIGLN